ncbi:MAG: hypothetical protein AB8B80_03470 [Marinicellaceae bacterium]
MNKILIKIVVIMGLFFSYSVKPNNHEKVIKSMIDLSPNKPVHKLFPLTILSINGESVNHRNDMIMLEPGEYKFKFLANVDLRFFAESDRIIRTKINQRKYHDSLELIVEPGTSYQLGFDASSRKIEDWRPVLLSTTKK